MIEPGRTKQFQKIVAIGESITAGGSASSYEKCWVSRLLALIGEFQFEAPVLINKGIGSNILCKDSPCYPYASHPAGEARVFRDMIDHQPDLALISFGLNDMRGGTNPAIFKETLSGFVHIIKKETSALIVLLGMYYMTGYDRYEEIWAFGSDKNAYLFNDIIRETADENSVLFADIFSALNGTKWFLDADGVHANDLGHAVIANKVFEVIAQSSSSLADKANGAIAEKPGWRDESALVDEDSLERYKEMLQKR